MSERYLAIKVVMMPRDANPQIGVATLPGALHPWQAQPAGDGGRPGQARDLGPTSACVWQFRAAA